jgi:hypothetical protein
MYCHILSMALKLLKMADLDFRLGAEVHHKLLFPVLWNQKVPLTAKPIMLLSNWAAVAAAVVGRTGGGINVSRA